MTLKEKFEVLFNFVRKLADYGKKAVRLLLMILAGSVALALIILLLRYLFS